MQTSEQIQWYLKKKEAFKKDVVEVSGLSSDMQAQSIRSFMCGAVASVFALVKANVLTKDQWEDFYLFIKKEMLVDLMSDLNTIMKKHEGKKDDAVN